RHDRSDDERQGAVDPGHRVPGDPGEEPETERPPRLKRACREEAGNGDQQDDDRDREDPAGTSKEPIREPRRLTIGQEMWLGCYCHRLSSSTRRAATRPTNGRPGRPVATWLRVAAPSTYGQR